MCVSAILNSPFHNPLLIASNDTAHIRPQIVSMEEAAAAILRHSAELRWFQFVSSSVAHACTGTHMNTHITFRRFTTPLQAQA